MNKEENSRLKIRTEERLEIAQAKENYWKWYREGEKMTRSGETERGQEGRRKNQENG